MGHHLRSRPFDSPSSPKLRFAECGACKARSFLPRLHRYQPSVRLDRRLTDSSLVQPHTQKTILAPLDTRRSPARQSALDDCFCPSHRSPTRGQACHEPLLRRDYGSPHSPSTEDDFLDRVAPRRIPNCRREGKRYTWPRQPRRCLLRGSRWMARQRTGHPAGELEGQNARQSVGTPSEASKLGDQLRAKNAWTHRSERLGRCRLFDRCRVRTRAHPNRRIVNSDRFLHDPLAVPGAAYPPHPQPPSSHLLGLPTDPTGHSQTTTARIHPTPIRT